MTDASGTDSADYSPSVIAIGRLALAFSLLEGRLHQLAWAAIGRPGMGQLITDGMPANAVSRLLRRISVLCYDRDRILAITDEFDRLSKIRNIALHGVHAETGDIHSLRDRLKQVSGKGLKAGI